MYCEYIEGRVRRMEACRDRIESDERGEARTIEDAEFEALTWIRRARGLRAGNFEDDKVYAGSVENRVVCEENLDDSDASASDVDALDEIASRQRCRER